MGLFMNKIMFLFAPVGVECNAFMLNLRANMALTAYTFSPYEQIFKVGQTVYL